MSHGGADDRLGGWYPTGQDNWAYNLPNGEQTLLIFEDGESLQEQVEYIRNYLTDPADVQRDHQNSQRARGAVHLDARGNPTGIRRLGGHGHGGYDDGTVRGLDHESGRLNHQGRGWTGGHHRSGEGRNTNNNPHMGHYRTGPTDDGGGGRYGRVEGDYGGRGGRSPDRMRADEDRDAYRERLLRESDELIERIQRQNESFSRQSQGREGMQGHGYDEGRYGGRGGRY